MVVDFGVGIGVTLLPQYLRVRAAALNPKSGSLESKLPTATFWSQLKSARSLQISEAPQVSARSHNQAINAWAPSTSRNIPQVSLLRCAPPWEIHLFSAKQPYYSYPNFLNLPLELREMIYELLFSTKLSNKIVDLRRVSRVSFGVRLPINIMLTCRQIHDEALAVFYHLQTAEFTYRSWQPK